MGISKRVIIFVAILAALSLVARFLPHPPNFVPVGALALLTGTIFRNNLVAFFAPLLVFLSDIFIGFYEWKVMVAVYLSFFLYFLVGKIFKEERFRGVLAPITGAVLFYLITNFAVWAWSPLYLKTFDGLILSYLMALPFFKSTLLADMIFFPAFLVAYALVLDHKRVFQAVLSKFRFAFLKSRV